MSLLCPVVTYGAVDEIKPHHAVGVQASDTPRNVLNAKDSSATLTLSESVDS